MQEKHLFEYAVIRVVPRADREEFLNIGVILYCRKLKFLRTIFTLNREKLLTLWPDLDLEQLEKYVEALEKIAGGHQSSGPIGKLDIASRFRWLTATRSTILQVSKVHPGLCEDPEKLLNRLHEQLVL